MYDSQYRKIVVKNMDSNFKRNLIQGKYVI